MEIDVGKGSSVNVYVSWVKAQQQLLLMYWQKTVNIYRTYYTLLLSKECNVQAMLKQSLSIEVSEASMGQFVDSL